MPRMALSGVLLLLAFTSVASAEQYILRLERVTPAGGWARPFSKEPVPAQVLELLVETGVPFEVEASLSGDETLGFRGVLTGSEDETYQLSLAAESGRRVSPISHRPGEDEDFRRDLVRAKDEWSAQVGELHELPELKASPSNVGKRQIKPGETWRVTLREVREEEIPTRVAAKRNSAHAVQVSATDSSPERLVIRISQTGWLEIPEANWDKRPPAIDLIVLKVNTEVGAIFLARAQFGSKELLTSGYMEPCVQTDAMPSVYPTELVVKLLEPTGKFTTGPDGKKSEITNESNTSTRTALAPGRNTLIGGSASTSEQEVRGKKVRFREETSFRAKLSTPPPTAAHRPD